MTDVLAAAGFQNSLFWAVFIGWILSVVLHEFAHGIVAYWGGDWTIRERGGLTLNPLQYVDPVMSLLMPAIFLILGGVPLPGGSTFVRRDLLRSRGWETAVSLAGPAMNLLLFAVGAIALHPKVGWAPELGSGVPWSNAQKLVATLTVLQLFATIANLIPMPPLDGFNALTPFMKPETRDKLTTPPTSTGLMIVAFMLLFSSAVQKYIYDLIFKVLALIGYDDLRIIQMIDAIRQVLFDK
jgi:Zn-dependent protease